jgi:hypothetical protein
VPKPSGWGFRATSVVVNGTTGLTISKPAGTVDNDCMFMFLVHKGAGYATLPAGWTPVIQDISGSTRGELHWKRASGEGANYAITGLADTARGCIISYSGGKLTGDIVAASNSSANAAGTRTTGAITVADPHCLYLGAVAQGGAGSLSFFGSNGSLLDPDTRNMGLRELGTSTTGTDCGLGVWNAIAIVPMAHPALNWSASGTQFENVGMVAAFLPEVDAATAGTRFYPARKHPGVRIDDDLDGEWDSSRSSPYAWAASACNTFELSQIKTDAGNASTRSMVTNQTDYSVLAGRWITPPLEAQTISGTFDLTWLVGRSWTGTGGVSADVDVRYKVHIYITQGQSGLVRHVLLDNYVDSSAFSTVGGVNKALAAAQTLTNGDAEDGDCVMIEFGLKFVSIPTPTPVDQPDSWAPVTLSDAGAGAPGNFVNHAAVPLQDRIAGSTGSVSHFDFTHTFVEKARPAGPSNTTAGAATVIPGALPFDSGWIDTTQADSVNRDIYFEWTAPQDGRAIWTLLGTNYSAFLSVTWDALLGPDSFVVTQTGDLSADRNDYILVIEVEAGVTYTIRLANFTDTTAHSSGGAARLTGYWASAPQEDDLFVPAANLYVLRDGAIVNVTPDFRNFATSAIGMDFSGRPIDDLNGGVHTGPRVYLGLHNVHGIEILDATTLNIGTLEVDYLYSQWEGAGANPDNLHPSTLHIGADGKLYTGWFGSGYLHVNGNSSSDRAAFKNYPSEFVGEAAVRVIDATLAENQVGGPYAAAADTYIPDGDKTDPWSIALAPDGETLYYAAGGFYYGTNTQIAGVSYDNRAAVIKRFHIPSNTQLSDLGTVTLTVGPNPGIKGIDVHPGGDVLICNGSQIDRMDSSGSVVQSYVPTPSEKARSLICVRYNSTGRKFWAFDQGTATLFQYDVVSGAQLSAVDTWFWPRVTMQMVPYLPSGIAADVASVLPCLHGSYRRTISLTGSYSRTLRATGSYRRTIDGLSGSYQRALSTFMASHRRTITGLRAQWGSPAPQHIGPSEGWFVGEDKTLEFEVFDRTTMKDVTGWALTFRMREIGGSDRVVMTKTTAAGSIEIDGTYDTDREINEQRVSVDTSSTDTSNLQPGQYQYSLLRTDAGSETAIATGFTTLLRGR